MHNQDKYPLRTAIDQRGEQTLNKDAKSESCIIIFANDEAAVLKWTLKRSKQAESTYALMNSFYKSLRLSQIIKSENQVQAVIKIFKEEYINNPFDKLLDKSSLYHLSSGIPVPVDMENNILNIPNLEKLTLKQLREERLESTGVTFHEPIKKNNVKLFRDLGEKIKLCKDNKTKLTEANKNVLGTLIACSVK